MIENLKIKDLELNKDIIQCNDEIYTFFTSYKCPFCGNDVIMSSNYIKKHDIFYAFYPAWDRQKDDAVCFEGEDDNDLFTNFDLGHRSCIIEGLKSAVLEYQKIAYKLLKDNYIVHINYAHHDGMTTNGCFIPDTNEIFIDVCDTANLYHEIGHDIYHNFSNLFENLNKAMKEEYNLSTKKKIDDYFNNTFSVKKVYNLAFNEEPDFYDILITKTKECSKHLYFGSLYADLYYYLGNNYGHLIDVSSALRCDEDDGEIIHLPGHDIEYWQRANIKTDELFANIFCEYATGRSDVIKLFKRFLPKCLDEYKKIINTLMKYLDIIG